MNRRREASSLAGRAARSIGAAAGLFLLGAQPARATDTLCIDGEYPAFSCGIKDSQKQLAICLHDNAVIYRFGKPGHIELEYPGNTEEGKFIRAQSAYPQGTETVLRFDRGGTRYTIDDEEDANAADASAAWITVTRGKKQLAKLDCAPGFKAGWKLLDNVLPAKVSDDALGAADAAGAAASPAAPAPAPDAKPAAAGACTTSPAALSGYPKQVAEIFRTYAEHTDGLYDFAVKQFGAPVACAIKSDNDPKLPPAESPDETNFSGSFRYTFKGGAQLIFVMAGPLDLSLIAPDGFPDAKAAKAALEKRAGFALAKAKKATKDVLENMPPWTDADGKSPPALLGPGPVKTQVYSDPNVDADEQTTYAELTMRGTKLIAIRTH